jgi:hypothetical protein
VLQQPSTKHVINKIKPLIIIGVGVCVLGLGTAALFYYIEKSHTHNNTPKRIATPNPIYEMQLSDLTKSKTTQNQMRVAL